MQPDLSIIIVTWNVWDLLRACLQSIEQASRALGASGAPSIQGALRAFGPVTLGKQAPTLEVIVVDNASADATAELLPARFPWVRFIRSATNLGFTAGNNVGYATSRGRVIYFLNPDTELIVRSGQTASTTRSAESDALWTLYSALINNPKVGLVGPLLRYPDNSIQSSRRRFPTRLTALFESGTLGRYWPNNPWLRRLLMADWPDDFRQEVDWVSGAALMARREALEKIRQTEATGPFDESYFMYCEEVDLCYRLRHAGWQIVYVPEATVIHYEGRSSGQVLAARDIYFFRSKVLYSQKYFGARWAEFMRIAFLWNFRGQLLIEAGKWLLGHKRELRRKRIAAYRKVLASKLRPEAKARTTSDEL